MKALLMRDLYSELEALPDALIGEILNGQLHAHPRPGGKHVLVASNIGIEIGGPFHKGKGGPGGWWILIEPEIHLALDTEVVVPDVAGWRRERLPSIQDGHKFTVAPDWICEVISPSSESFDRNLKMPIYAQYGIPYFWLIDPLKQKLEAYCLENASWRSIGVFQGDKIISVDPFGSIQLKMSELWD